ncbi:hypothetical protein AL036_14710 [Salipiger aestuarii]|uniref:Uncharacterized protein n=1 Tax=Salipiger aestuarii TaxID=568098 RepID=A0A327XUB2_9RHOB|nr:hypothetical protein [Salipiger aestuarii]EIE49050.1 hypothetical protein C357_20807 [Citreicella sp. 357]KAA8606402.1 hypothetical protein AL036_14710 [Salipiger aestuarii]KAB2540716.1 hypothetical protein AL035_16085 [Salipiger aestuarii]RAK11687.1 hypothetical protein ATI53_104723 [Salipiger aestuarii]
MELWIFFLVAYAAVTAAALVMTFREQRSKGISTRVHIAAGYMLCTAWPAVVAVMVIFYKPMLQDS